MNDLLTADRMRAIEEAAIASGAVTGLELMERAGTEVVQAVLEEWPELAEGARRAVVLCGPGNNGGDGFVIARLLHRRGWRVDVYLYGDSARLPPDAKTNHDAWRDIGPVHPMTRERHRDPNFRDPVPDLWVDAIFGIGQSRPLPAEVTQTLHSVEDERNRCSAPVVAVDIPTGLSSDTGESVQPFSLSADLTVTFHGRKVGHASATGKARCGKVVVRDIGL